MNSSPPLDPQTEDQVSEMWTEAARIVSRMETSPHSKFTQLVQRLKPNLSEMEKDEVRDLLKKETLSALIVGGIPHRMTDNMVMAFVNLTMGNIFLLYAKTGSSIILYLKCGSVESLLNLKEMILSGVLLRLFSGVIEEFIEIRPQIQLVVKAEDYNLTLTYLNGVDGKFLPAR